MPTYLINPESKASFFNDFYKDKTCKIRTGKFQQLNTFTEDNYKEKQKLPVIYVLIGFRNVFISSERYTCQICTVY